MRADLYNYAQDWVSGQIANSDIVCVWSGIVWPDTIIIGIPCPDVHYNLTLTH
jgi:hypothetical protein